MCPPHPPRRSPFALPALLLLAPALFYGVLAAAGMSLADAREAGWVSKPQPGDGEWRFWRAWSLYGVHDFPPSNILWAAMPGQASGGGGGGGGGGGDRMGPLRA